MPKHVEYFKDFTQNCETIFTSFFQLFFDFFKKSQTIDPILKNQQFFDHILNNLNF